MSIKPLSSNLFCVNELSEIAEHTIFLISKKIHAEYFCALQTENNKLYKFI